MQFLSRQSMRGKDSGQSNHTAFLAVFKNTFLLLLIFFFFPSFLIIIIIQITIYKPIQRPTTTAYFSSQHIFFVLSTYTSVSNKRHNSSSTITLFKTSNNTAKMSAQKTSAIADQEPVDVLFAIHEKFDLLDFAGALEVFTTASHDFKDPDSK